MQPECIQECTILMAMEHQIICEIHKLLIPRLDSGLVTLIHFTVEFWQVDVKIRHGTPEVTPPLGQHARLYHLVCLEERHDGVDEGIRQGAQPVVAVGAPCTGPFSGGIHGFRGLGSESCKPPVAIKNTTFTEENLHPELLVLTRNENTN
jgi:hypothetical protein